ncbi:hypothetical protein GJ496_009607 [Pomphorhynchus laevis]|nr:hypothetical protein GJ496_009607 [Pomphorhynchus laevis]
MEGFGLFFGCRQDTNECNDDDKFLPLMESQSSNLPPEEHLGNVEYKLKLVNPDPERIEHLTTQMKWRLEEGNGVALYELGVEDNGNVIGLAAAEFNSSLKTMNSMVDKLNARMDIIKIKRMHCSGNVILFAAEVLVHLSHHITTDICEIRIAFIGSTDSGKSSLIGTLCSGLYDNGNGRSRLTLFRHLHEVVTGRTSSVTEQIIGVEKRTGSVMTLAKCRNPMEMLFRCEKLITLIDLAGHRKYTRTTLFGLTSRKPHFVMVVINKLRGLVSSVIDQINYALSMNILPIIVLTKIDLYSSILGNSNDNDSDCKDPQLRSIVKELSFANFINHLPQCHIIKQNDDMRFVAEQFIDRVITPLFQVSCVTGCGLDNLYGFMCSLSNNQQQIVNPIITNISLPNDIEFQIDHVFSFDKSVLIVRGLQLRGLLHVKDRIFLGPFANGRFVKVKVKSIRRLNVPVNAIYCGQSGSIALVLNEVKIIRKKGLVLISNSSDQSNVCRTMQGNIRILPSKNNKITLHPGCRYTLHMNNICQTVIINSYQECSNEVTLTFHTSYEYVKIGCQFILWNIRAIGVVTKLL